MKLLTAVCLIGVSISLLSSCAKESAGTVAPLPTGMAPQTGRIPSPGNQNATHLMQGSRMMTPGASSSGY